MVNQSSRARFLYYWYVAFLRSTIRHMPPNKRPARRRARRKSQRDMKPRSEATSSFNSKPAPSRAGLAATHIANSETSDRPNVRPSQFLRPPLFFLPILSLVQRQLYLGNGRPQPLVTLSTLKGIPFAACIAYHDRLIRRYNGLPPEACPA